MEVSDMDRSAGKLPVLSFYYAGIAAILSWNMVLTFIHTFDCDMVQGKSFGGAGFAFWCSIVYSLMLNIIGLVMTSRSVVARFSFQTRWTIGCLGQALSIAALLNCYALKNKFSVDTIFGASMVSTAFTGLTAGILQNSAFGLAGAISPRLVQAIMGGQGFAGLLAGAVGIFFGGSDAALAVSFLASVLVVVAGLPIYAVIISKNKHVEAKLGNSRESDNLTSETDDATSDTSGSPSSTRARSAAQIMRKAAWPQALTVSFVFIVTFTVFPGVISRWVPGNRVPTLIAVFQVLDVIGRTAPQFEGLQINQGWIVTVLSLLRAAFVPAFILVQRASNQHWAQEAWIQILLMGLFAFSNGYVSTLSMMLGPSQKGVAKEEQETVGVMMSLSLVFGILLGSFVALPTQIGTSQVASCSGSG